MYKECNDYKIPYKLRFIDSNKFPMGLLENLVNNLSQLNDCNGSDKSNQKNRIKQEYEYLHKM